MSQPSHGKQFSAPMTDAVRDQLLAEQTECTFIWQGKSDPYGTIMIYIWDNGSVWLTTNDARPRVAAVKKSGRATVVISSAGTALGDSRCISMRGHCAILNDRETRDWFFPLFCEKLLPGNVAAQTAMRDLLDRDGQVILQLLPDKAIAYDGDALMRKLEAL